MAQRNASGLPTDIIDNILQQIEKGHDRASFSRICRTFHKSFANASMHYIDIDFAESDSEGCFVNPWTSSIQLISVDGWASYIHADRIERPFNVSHSNDIKCTKAKCRACTLAGTMGALDAFLASQRNQVSKQSRLLTFRGHFRNRTRFMSDSVETLEHRFVGDGGLAALAPQRFEFNMHWTYWDTAILNVVSTSQLVSLKLPLAVPLDCVELGRTLVAMPVLKSLTITDMADNPWFLRGFPFLGLGIRSRSASLRDLDLSMTNCNRPNFNGNTWERLTIEHEPFVKPAALDHFLSAIFPKSIGDIPEEVRQQYADFEYQIRKDMEHPEDCAQGLKLDKLRLKRIDLPAYSFNEVFDGTNLRELRLPFCDVDQEVWLSIGTKQLAVLEDIDYELLLNYDLLDLRTFERFLQSQAILQSLSFARPSDQYLAVEPWVWYGGDEAPTLPMQLFQLASPLSQATNWAKASCLSPPSSETRQLPTLKWILDTLSKAKIKNLLLPAGMFDITPDHMCKIAVSLPFLQHLTWGFSYEDAEIRRAFQESFLPNLPSSLRKITFLSLRLPSGYDGTPRNDLTFNAPEFHDYVTSLSDQIPQTIRYLRYRHLLSQPYQGKPQKTTTWYHRREPRNGNRWIELDDRDGENMFEEERTPRIWPVTEADKWVERWRELKQQESLDSTMA